MQKLLTIELDESSNCFGSVTQNILARGTNANGIGWLLRGYFRDHVRVMASGELRDFETVLAYNSQDLANYLECISLTLKVT